MSIYKHARLNANVTVFLKKVDLGSKMQDGEPLPVYKMQLESDEIKHEDMDALFGMHRKNALIDIGLYSTKEVEFKAYLRKVNISQKKSADSVVPVYQINLEIPMGEMDTDTMAIIHSIHRSMSYSVQFVSSWTDPQLAMDLSPAVSTPIHKEIDMHTGEITDHSAPALTEEEAIQFFDDEPGEND